MALPDGITLGDLKLSTRQVVRVVEKYRHRNNYLQ